MRADFKRLRNPIVKQRKKQAIRRKLILYTISVFALLILIIYTIFATSLFQIQEIKINELQEADKEEIMQIIEKQKQSRLFYIFSQENLLLFNKQKLKNDLSDYNFKKISINKKLFSTLEIHIEERKLSYILEDNQSTYHYLDEEMNLIKSFNICETEELNVIEIGEDEELGDYEFQTAQFEETDDTRIDIEENTDIIMDCHTDNKQILEQNFIPLIKNTSSDTLIDSNSNTAKINEDQINIIKFLYNNLIAFDSDMRLDYFIIDATMFEVKARLKNETILIFSTKDKIEDQYKRLSLFIDEYKDDINEMDTIDFRYQDMIYYRKD